MRMAYIIMMLATVLGLRQQSGLASMYEPGDRSCGTMRADGKRFTAEDSHIAHRWLPLGTEGVVCNQRTFQCTRTVVLDRGPFGAIKPCTPPQPEPYSVAGRTFRVRRINWAKKCWWWQPQPYKLQRGFKYRGQFDLTRPVAERIGLRGFDRVVFYYGVHQWPTKKIPRPVPQVFAFLFDLSRTR